MFYVRHLKVVSVGYLSNPYRHERAQMKQHVYNLAKFDYVTFITEYARRTAVQHGPVPPDDIQRKMVRS